MDFSCGRVENMVKRGEFLGFLHHAFTDVLP